MLEPSQLIPWESFQALRSLSYHISHHLWELSNPEVDYQSSTSIFTGPSRLPNLQDLHVTYRNRGLFPNEGALDVALHPIYFYDLNKTTEDPKAFSSLQTFRIEVMCMLRGRQSSCTQKGDQERLAQIVVDWLPAIFGVGGRKEKCGWTASVVPIVCIVPWPGCP